MLQIDWLPIPKGNFIYGLKQSQLERLWMQFPKNIMDDTRLKRIYRDLERETPERIISLSEFYISRYPITNAQFIEFAFQEHRYSYPSRYPNHTNILQRRKQLAETQATIPAQVSWHESLVFCEWLGSRLPTSVEWEKAARGHEGYLYPWGNEWDSSRGHFSREDAWGKVAPVDAFPSGASPYGVVDMMGNTYEWTLSNGFDAGYSGSGEPVVCRGCSWEIAEMSLPDWFAGRVTNQTFNPMHGPGLNHVGFRPIRDKWYLTIFPATVAPSDDV